MKKIVALILPQKTGGTHIERKFAEYGVEYVHLNSLEEDPSEMLRDRESRCITGLLNPKHFSCSGFDIPACTIDMEQLRQYTSIGLIRCPYTWLTSWFTHNVGDRIDRWDLDPLKPAQDDGINRVVPAGSWKSFVMKFCTGYVPRRQKNTMVNATEDYPMHHIFTPDGEVACDYLIYNEGLNHGINQILHRQGLDVRVDLGERTLKGSYTNDQFWFDEEMEEAVNQCFGDFMELFGYSYKPEKLPSPIISGKGLRLKNFKRIR